MDRKEAVRLLSQAISNLRDDYPYKSETWRAFGYLNIRSLADTAFEEVTIAPKIRLGIVLVEYEDKPFVRFSPEKVDSPSFYIGEIKTNYETLCSIFGRHDKWHDTYKQDASWHIEFKDGEKVTISNFKDGHNYLGRKGKNLVDIKRWDVHGTKEGLALLKKTIKQVISPVCPEK